MSQQSLWGELPASSETKSPIAILREQATALRDATNGMLTGDVSATASDMRFTASLYVVAPALNNYRYEVLTVQHPVAFYPVAIRSRAVLRPLEAKNEEEFLGHLEKILTSRKIHSVIASLISMSTSSGGSFVDEEGGE